MKAMLTVDAPPSNRDHRLAELEVGDLLLHYLEQIDVGYVFGVPGGAIEPLYNALARSGRRGGPRPVVARHETGAAFMAQGYGCETGKLGVCCVTTGPGATNVLTGVASAYLDEIPMLVISGQTSMHNFGCGALQDSSHNGVDTLGLFQHCTRYNTLISDVAQFEKKLVTAIMAAQGDPPGPVHITVPVDLMRKPSGVGKPSLDLRTLLQPAAMIDINALESLWNTIVRSKRLVCVIGEGCAKAAEQIVRFAEHFNACLVTTPGAKGLIDPYHSLYRGVFGFAGHSSAREVLISPSVDCILAIGTGLGEWDTAGWDSALLNKRLIHIDPVRSHFTRSSTARMHIQGRVETIFQQLIQRIGIQKNFCDQMSRMKNTPPECKTNRFKQPAFMPYTAAHYTEGVNGIPPQTLMLELARRFPCGTRFFADAGNSIAWSIHYLHAEAVSTGKEKRAGWYRTSTQFASMGWAIGNAVGAAMGNTKTSVVCITGDGSLLMNGQELTVAVAEQLNIIFVVLNDSAFGMVKHGQRLAGAEPVAYELPRVDFCAIAQAMGANAYRLRTMFEFNALDIEALCHLQGPTLLDVYIDAEATPPMGTRVKVLGGALS